MISEPRSGADCSGMRTRLGAVAGATGPARDHYETSQRGERAELSGEKRCPVGRERHELRLLAAPRKPPLLSHVPRVPEGIAPGLRPDGQPMRHAAYGNRLHRAVVGVEGVDDAIITAG